jgi:hypothetical protein
LTVIEKSEAARRRARRIAVTSTVSDHLGVSDQYDLIVGCTGVNAFKVEDRRLLRDGALLASGSSAALEFDRVGFVELANRYPDDEIEILDAEGTRAAGIHADIRFRFEDRREAVFLNAGFPLNFDGTVESLPAHMIQGTRSLLYAAAAQAVDNPEPGLGMLNSHVDEWIFQNALDFL